MAVANDWADGTGIEEIPSDVKAGSEKKSTWRVARQAIGYIIALLCLIWVFHDLDGGKFISQINNITWGWVILGVFCDFLSYVFQGLRWRLVLKPITDVPLLRTTQAIYSGIFTNEILPFRAGELVRCYLVSRWAKARFVMVLPSILVERFFDSIWIALGVGLTAILADLPEDLTIGAEFFGGLVMVFVVIFILLVLRREKELQEGGGKDHGGIARPAMDFLNRLANGIKSIGTSRNFYLAFVCSSLILIFQILAFWLILVAYGLHLHIWTAAAVMMIVLLGISIPNAPSNVGTYQFFIVVGLTLFGIDKTTASGFSLVVFVVLTIPLWLLGYLAISRTGLTIKEIRGKISEFMRRK